VVIQIYTISSVVFFFFATIFYLSLHFSEEPKIMKKLQKTLRLPDGYVINMKH